MKKAPLLVVCMTTSLLLSGCAAGILAGAGVAGAAVGVAHDRRSSGTVIDDRTTRIRIANSINSDATLDNFSHTNLAVFNHVALITGEVANEDIHQKILAKIKAHRYIKRVEDGLKVQANSGLLSRGNDSAITTKVNTALLGLRIKNFDPTLIKVVTERGNVYLLGLVTKQEGTQIAEVTRRVRGVKSVTKVFEYVTLKSK